MSIHLFKHNQEAYNSVTAMLEREKMAAVIHPTGTGKSLIAFKLAEEHPSEKFLWLSPSEYIYQTQLENLGMEFDNIQFMSYSRLMKNEDSIETLHPDYIILDEFHRCGAAEWGKSVRKLLTACPDAKRLGLSATNIRYLDNQRNMAEEIFDGKIASEMTLGEAIVRGILPEPKYVIAMYSYKKELDQLKKRVQALSNQGLITENQKLLEQLRRALEQAEGLDIVFEKHMEKKNGKYIVFCSGKEHMDEMKEQASTWFRRVDREPRIYTAFYNDTATDREFREFKKDNSAHLKLLFCIDMLNEGVHVDDVDGVILLRPTVSPIIYLQQIGRALSAGSRKTPVIFDLVNNFDSLYCIDSLKKELEEAFAMFPTTYGEGTHFSGRFQITDEIKDCRVLFQKLQANLSSAWETYYIAAKQWYQENGNLRVPKNYVTASGLTLGSWIQTQRRVYTGTVTGNLTEEKVRKLNEISMIWDVRDHGWNEVFIPPCAESEYPNELMRAFLEMGIAVHTGITKSGSFPAGCQQVEKIGVYTVITTSMNYAESSKLLVKRLMDIAGGLVGCLITLLITIIVGPMIYISSPGPIFFAQERIGRNGRKFKMYKFRSMYMDAEERKKELMAQNKISDGLMFKMDFDPRIIGNKILPDGTRKTGIGQFIRKTSLDEFPQFINILLGDMSLVGTRPPTVDEWELYEPHHRARMSFRPGLTGMWQVSGRSNITDFEEVVKLDTQYISEWSLRLDVKILWKTVWSVFKSDGAM